MNREFKFRLWYRERMEYVPDWGDMYDEIVHSKLMYNNNACPVMQYTGLKDKNGKEIYEGDIVKIHEEELSGVVKFREGCFMVATKENNHYGDWYLSCEAIGNIYENPEVKPKDI